MKRKLLNYLIPILMTPCLMNASENLEESSGRVRCGNARFSCLSDAMIRIEFDTEGKFDDRPTLRTLSMPEPKKFEEVKYIPGGVAIRTPYVKIYYKDGPELTKENLKIEWEKGGMIGEWRYGDLDQENLGAVVGMDHVYDAMVGNGKVFPGGDWKYERYGELPLLYISSTLYDWRNANKTDYQPVGNDLWCTFRDYDELPKEMQKICDVAKTAPPGPVSKAGYFMLDETWMYMYDREKEWLDTESIRDGYKNLFFFCYGKNYGDALKEFTTLCGKIPMLPRWAYGSWYSRFHPYTAEEIKDVVKKHRECKMPLDVLIVDMDWHINGWSGWEWNKEKFPDPEGFFKWAHENGVKVGLNVHSEGIPKNDEAYKEMAASLGIDPQNPPPLPQRDWKEFREKMGISIWNRGHGGDSFAMDYLDKDIWEAFEKYTYDPNDAKGVDLWWEDNWQGIMAHCNFNLWMDELMFRHHLKQGKRPIALNRYAGLGSQRYPAYFSGDTASHWPVLNYEFDVNRRAAHEGMSYFSHDLGGFKGEVTGFHPGHISPELLIRWVQMGALCPIMRVHSDHGIREAWNYNKETENIIRDAYQLHNKLVPYFYHLARDAYETGMPIHRPVYFLFPEDEEAYSFTHSYFIGDKLFFAPAGTPGGFMKFKLPKGTYYHYTTGEKFEGGKTIKKQVELNEFNLFVRAGAIIPNMDYVESIGTTLPDPLVLAIYPGGSDRIEIYEDDGESLDYDKNYSRLPVTMEEKDGKLVVTQEPIKGGFKSMPEKRNIRIDIYFAGEPKDAVFGCQNAKESYDAGKKCYSVYVPDLNVKEKHQWTFNFEKE